MVLIGDVLAWIGALVLIGITSWATILASALLFDGASSRADGAISTRPWHVVWVGLLITLTLGSLSVVLIAQPNPLGKLLGWILLAYLLFVAVLGASGVARMVATRIRELHDDLPAYNALSRGVILIIGAAMLPVVGTLLIAPAVLVVSLGAGWAALSRKARLAAQAPVS